MEFLQTMIEKAKSDIKTIVLPETEDIRTLKAADEVLKQGIANLVLIGNEDQIKKDAVGLDLTKATIIDIDKFDRLDEYATKLFELRKHKGMTLEKAKETLKNKIYFGIMMVKMNEADGLVAGAVNSTANTLRPALQILKTAPGTKLVSAFFIMCVPNCEYGSNGTFAYGDCGLNENPDAQALSEFAFST
jgi:phosphate acetyltransferase